MFIPDREVLCCSFTASDLLICPQEYRYRVNLVTEKLKQIIAPTSQPDGEEHGLQLWLRDYVDSKKHEDAPVSCLTRSEELADRANNELATILREACDKDRWVDEKFQGLLDARNASLHRVLDDNARVISNMDQVVPAFWDTLHYLYTAYDVAKTTLDFCNHIAKQGTTVYEDQKEVAKDIVGSAQRLLDAVLEKAKIVKKGLDDGGFIDKILDGGLPDDGEAFVTAEAVRELIDENFLEEWAGAVVESWGDSVAGLSLLKPTKT